MEPKAWVFYLQSTPPDPRSHPGSPVLGRGTWRRRGAGRGIGPGGESRFTPNPGPGPFRDPGSVRERGSGHGGDAAVVVDASRDL